MVSFLLNRNVTEWMQRQADEHINDQGVATWVVREASSMFNANRLITGLEVNFIYDPVVGEVLELLPLPPGSKLKLRGQQPPMWGFE